MLTEITYRRSQYCIRRPLSKRDMVPLFHLAQEDLQEPHAGLAVLSDTDSLRIDAVQVTFNSSDYSAVGPNGQQLPNDAFVFTAPAIVWRGAFVGWESYARATYDCRHIIKLQYVDRNAYPEEFERIRAEIERLQCLWQDRERYVAEVLRLAEEKIVPY